MCFATCLRAALNSFENLSTNVSSWNKHGEALLDFADREEVLVVRAQEANLASDEIGTAMWNARRQGWQTLFVPPFGNNRGGLAVAVKEPLAVSQVNSCPPMMVKTCRLKFMVCSALLGCSTFTSVPNVGILKCSIPWPAFNSSGFAVVTSISG